MKKTAAIILTALLAISALGLAATAFAMPMMGRPFMHWGNIIQNMGPGNWNRVPLQQSSVRVNGIVTDWGTTEVNGTMSAFSKTVVINNTAVRQGASASAIWTTNESRPIVALRTRENFTYTFYTANLVSANVSSLNVTGYSYFLNGTWNVFNVTSTFTINTDNAGNILAFNRSQSAVAIATDAYGELKVPANANTFTLKIEGIDQLTGTVHAQRIISRLCNAFRINDDDSTTVTPADVASVVSAYGSSPGWGSYNQRMDYNFNYKVDICDLATASANLNR
jgi:hypothetical protein